MHVATTNRSLVEVISIAFAPVSAATIMVHQDDSLAVDNQLMNLVIIGLAIAFLVYTRGPLAFRLVGIGTLLAASFAMSSWALELNLVFGNLVFIANCVMMLMICSFTLCVLRSFIDTDESF